jgi:sporulation integral membrane protein YtvI
VEGNDDMRGDKLSKEKYIKIAIIAIGVILTIILLPHLVKLFAPFLLAFLLASALQKPVKFLRKKFKIPCGLSAFGFVFVILGFIITILYEIIYKIFTESVSFLNSLPATTEYFVNKLNSIIARYFIFYNNLSQAAKSRLDIISKSVASSFNNLLSSVMHKIMSLAGNFVTSIPSMLLFILITALSLFFFIKDYDAIVAWGAKKIPKKAKKRLNGLKITLFHVFFKYMKAILIIATISTIEVTVALWILRIDYWLLFGILAGICDAIPIVGTGIILTPLALTFLIGGNYYVALSIWAVEFICFLVKHIVEPKIVSQEVGVHPLVAIISVYVGAELFGPLGAVLGPITSFIAVNMACTYKNQIENVSAAENKNV